MAAAGPAHIEKVEAIVQDDVTYPWLMRVTWVGSYSLTGTPPFTEQIIVTERPLNTTDPLDQSAWDNIWANFQGAFATATGVTAPITNPVSL